MSVFQRDQNDQKKSNTFLLSVRAFIDLLSNLFLIKANNITKYSENEYIPQFSCLVCINWFIKKSQMTRQLRPHTTQHSVCKQRTNQCTPRSSGTDKCVQGSETDCLPFRFLQSRIFALTDEYPICAIETESICCHFSKNSTICQPQELTLPIKQ